MEARPGDARCVDAPAGYRHVCDGVGCFASPRCEGACAHDERCEHMPGAGACANVAPPRAYACAPTPPLWLLAGLPGDVAAGVGAGGDAAAAGVGAAADNALQRTWLRRERERDFFGSDRRMLRHR